MFRLKSLYFRETSARANGGADLPGSNRDAVHQQLLLALESARNKFAIAIAVETKSTPVETWRSYLDTAEQVRCFVRKFRRTNPGTLSEHQEWARALDTLQRMPAEQGSASHLCRILTDIMVQLE